MSEQELRKWARKYELWVKLHPGLKEPVARCVICQQGRKVGMDNYDKCPTYVLVYDTIMAEMDYRSDRNLGWCKEWVKYV